MGEDKSLLDYHGMSQIEYCYGLLKQICRSVYISNRTEQSILAEHSKTVQIHDEYSGIGPAGGILTAMEKFPEAAWFVLACDLPFITLNTLKSIYDNRDPLKNATVYKCQSKPGPEPLCGIYEPSVRSMIKKSISKKTVCPRLILSRADVKLIDPEGKNDLLNINDKEEYHKARRTLREIESNNGKAKS
jgi:molybdopterin-guanine dinucleotide biosynthesis protein A